MSGSCPRRGRAVVAAVLGFALGGAVMYFAGPRPDAAGSAERSVPASDAVKLGERLVAIGACHDCHTPMNEKGERAPRELWLAGTPVGWRGPWGTTYASNLRQMAASLPTSEAFVAIVRGRPPELRRPPMPWDALDAMTDAEIAAVHAYLSHLGPAPDASPVPAYLPPGVVPDGPWMSLDPALNK